jgi:phenylacetate-CoA ligase
MNTKKLEFKSRNQIEEVQVKYLKEAVKYASKHSPFYKKKLNKKTSLINSMKKLSDIQKLPITTKAQIQKDNRKFFCKGGDDIIEIVSTTGTTGEAVFIALTGSDLSRLALNEERSFLCAGVTKKDIFHIAVTLDNLFMAGMAYYLGITQLGATVFRAGMRNVKKQSQLIQQLAPTGIVTVPSFLLKLADAIKEEGGNPRKSTIKKALLVGESIREQDFSLNSLGTLISKKWPVDLYSTYGNSECGISFCECKEKAGGHEHPDLIISEILDDNSNPVPDGETGELVLTTLQAKGMPLLRYKTGDVTFKLTEKCKCGRKSSRIGPILGRKAQMMKFKGVKVYPKTIENAVLNTSGVHNYIIEAYTGDDYSDRIVVKIGCERKNKKIKEAVLKSIEAYARVTPEVKIVSIKEVDWLRTEGGSKRKMRIFIDNRKNGENYD